MPIDINPVVPQGRQLIQSYGDGQFNISTVVFQGSVLVFPDETTPWSVSSADEVSVDTLSPITSRADQFDILLIGSGASFGRIPADLRRGLKDIGLVLEWMDTGAACRTFNVLVGEERRVAAALIAVE